MRDKSQIGAVCWQTQKAFPLLTPGNVWIAGYASLGYFFGGQWEAVSQFVTDFSGFSVGLVLLGTGVVFGARYWRRAKLA